MRRLPPLLLALVLGLLAALAVACGDDDGDDRRLLAPSRAEAIRAELDKIAQRVESGRCDALDPAFDRLNRAIDGLPRATDRGLRRRLAEGAEHLEAIAPGECRDNRPKTAETTETAPETVPETVPETTETETQPETQTQPPQTETQPPQTEPPAETVPEDETGGSTAPESGFVPPGQAKKGDKGR
ncbi:MAG TPA: hypothetical protein VGW75_05570 [Solirubrobacteraceae bacterium]|nr:hypothetical protein [Solirubrobacteraceae bacterium]